MIHFTSDPQTPLPIAIGRGDLGVIIVNKIKYDNSTICNISINIIMYLETDWDIKKAGVIIFSLF